MIEQYLFGQPTNENEKALRNTLKMYLLSKFTDDIGSSLIDKFSTKTKIEKKQRELDLINASVQAGIDPNKTLDEVGLSNSETQNVMKFSGVASLFQKSKTPEPSLMFKNIKDEANFLLKNQTGSVIDFPFSRKLAKSLLKK